MADPGAPQQEPLLKVTRRYSTPSSFQEEFSGNFQAHVESQPGLGAMFAHVGGSWGPGMMDRVSVGQQKLQVA